MRSVVEQRGRSPGRVFCLVRCRSEPTNPTAQMDPFEFRRNQRKAASASPPRKMSRSGENHEPNGHGNTIYHNDEIAISFEQVEITTIMCSKGWDKFKFSTLRTLAFLKFTHAAVGRAANSQNFYELLGQAWHSHSSTKPFRFVL